MRLPLVCAFLALSAFAQSPEFEVASIKPSADPGAGRAQVGVRIDGAQVNCTYLSLKDYIAMAYNVKIYQITGPEWVGSLRYDIAAKIPAGATRKQIPEMMKALLAERFQLKVHNEKKEFAVYALIATKGGTGLKEAAPATSETGNVNVAGGGDARGTSVNLGNGASYTFSNDKFEATRLTMTAFADSLARLVEKPIVEMTGLPGTYDFSFDVTSEDFRAMQIRSGINAGVVLPPQVVQMADAFSGDALNGSLQKLGLKLESRKSPLDVVVVDSANKNPSAN